MNPGDNVRVTEELSWHHTTGTVIPAGAVVSLLWSFAMRDGVRRWAVRTASGIVAHSITDDLLEAV